MSISQKGAKALSMDFVDMNPPIGFDEKPAGFGPEFEATQQAISGSILARNKSERRRKQRLEAEPDKRASQSYVKPMTLAQKVDAWMINEGGRRIFVLVFLLLHLLIFALGFVNYQVKDNLTQARATYGITYPIARAAALVLHTDVALILLPVCRTTISLVRRTPLNHAIPFDKSITFHKTVGWSLCFFTVIHTVAHWVNFARLAGTMGATTGMKVVAFLQINFTTGPGATGYIMLVCLAAMAWTGREKARQSHYNRFWYTHHLFIIFFAMWAIHGAFCMIKPDRAPFCAQIAVFWKYWLAGGAIYLGERALREVRGRQRTYISKVVQHPSDVVEIQIKKPSCTTRAGQYVQFCCPEVSLFEWHPFTLTSAPEEDYISIHMRVAGDFTKTVAERLGCEFGTKIDKDAKVLNAGDTAALQRVLPRVMIDGPFGSASEDVFKFEVAVLVGGGIGVTPFASILKSIWYRINYPTKPTVLRKVYFFWVCRDFESFEWFQSLLRAIEEQDVDQYIEIHTYLTLKVHSDDMNNIMINDVGAEFDTVTKLRAPTLYGRPQWKRIFPAIAQTHPNTDVGVFFCGPSPLGHELHLCCDRFTDASTKFHWGKENF